MSSVNAQNNSRSNLVTEIQKLNDSFLAQKKGCPYSAMIAFINKCGNVLSGEKLPQIKHLISKLLHSALTAKIEVEGNVNEYNKLKIKKFSYDAALLESEVYEIIHSVLSPEPGSSTGDMAMLSSRRDLQDMDIRKAWGVQFFSVFHDELKVLIRERETIKMQDRVYREALDYAYDYSMRSKGKPSRYGQLFTSGAVDGFMNFRSIVGSIPELYKEKYKEMPSEETYRKVVQKNIKNVLLPLTTINLSMTLSILRSKEEHSREEEDILNNVLAISPEYFFLDDDGVIQISEAYMYRITERLQNVSHILQNNPENSLPVTIGCPALRAKKDNKNLIEHFFADIWTALDKVYFPYREK